MSIPQGRIVDPCPVRSYSLTPTSTRHNGMRRSLRDPSARSEDTPSAAARPTAIATLSSLPAARYGGGMSQDKNVTSPLFAAAEAFERELGRYQQLALSLERERLDSEKSLRRAAQSLGGIGDISDRLGGHLGALLSALTEARVRQESLSSSIQASAERIKQRGEILSALLQRWATLGEHAAELNRLTQRNPDEERGSNGGGAAFDELNNRLTQLAAEAQSFAETATSERFADLARQGEELRAHILSLRNKLLMAQRGSQ